MGKSLARASFWFTIIACVVFLVVSAPFLIAKRQKNTKTFICDQCGIRLWVTSDELVRSSGAARENRSLEQTELSRWFSAHITKNCPHTWRFNHSSRQTYVSLAGLRIWKISGGAGSSPTPPIVFFSADDRAKVESLFQRSPAACQKFIHDRLQGKEETD